ncbi:tail sheath protein [[Actinobacillus] muris]|uniref:Tail sheath protein n=1 Tax=Muribacter muris TaxID=67855 RepID=A0A0J5P1T4_9PAST|nr:phage tail sheath protein [Muribacter muris]KMK50488.1 tail sheath protein [[Actinobacillus] muris] [Muribacter muris]
MSDAYLHGVRVIEASDGTRTIRTVATAVIGLVCTADDADADFFPLNTPVLITNPTAAMANAGSTGTLKRALNAIGSIVNTPTVIVRVADSEDSDTLTANIVGTVTEEGKYTGLKALTVANSVVFVKPRLIAVPKFDNQAVASEIGVIAKKLNGFGFISSNGATTKEQAVSYARNFASRELMMIHGDFLSFNADTAATEVDYATVRACAIQAWIDKNIGWHKNVSNVEIAGVTGITHPLSFDIQDDSTDVNYLNSKNITVCLNNNGFKLWGSRTLSADTQFAFMQATRSAQIIKDTLGEAFDWAIDKPLTPNLAKDMLEMINSKFRFWKNLGYLVDGEAWLDVELNSKDQLKDGKFFIKYKYMWVPSLENLNMYQYIEDEYLVDFASKVASA